MIHITIEEAHIAGPPEMRNRSNGDVSRMTRMCTFRWFCDLCGQSGPTIGTIPDAQRYGRMHEIEHCKGFVPREWT